MVDYFGISASLGFIVFITYWFYWRFNQFWESSRTLEIRNVSEVVSAALFQSKFYAVSQYIWLSFVVAAFAMVMSSFLIGMI